LRKRRRSPAPSVAIACATPRASSETSARVTCYFCHNVVGVGSSHSNADIELANDTVMRAGITDPIDPDAHGAAYSRFHDRNAIESSLMCGTCDDIVSPIGVELEQPATTCSSR
jgi:hypothetical protein